MEEYPRIDSNTLKAILAVEIHKEFAKSVESD